MLSSKSNEELKLPPIKDKEQGVNRQHVEEFRSERKHWSSIDLTVLEHEAYKIRQDQDHESQNS